MNYKEVKEFLKSIDISKLDEKVNEALHNKRVVKILSGRASIWVFNGKERDYLLIPQIFCSCMDFELNVIIRGIKRACYHLITQYIAESTNAFRVLEVDEDTLNDILAELIHSEKSLTLRRLIALR